MRVNVKPKYKKCVTEITSYFNDSRTVEARMDTLWRWGEFEVDMSQEEYDMLVKESEDDSFSQSTEISAYDNFELIEVWDQCSVDLDFYSTVVTDPTTESDEYQEKLQAEEEGDDWDYDYDLWLEAEGFGYEPEYYETWITGPLVLEIVDEKV